MWQKSRLKRLRDLHLCWLELVDAARAIMTILFELAFWREEGRGQA